MLGWKALCTGPPGAAPLACFPPTPLAAALLGTEFLLLLDVRGQPAPLGLFGIPAAHRIHHESGLLGLRSHCVLLGPGPSDDPYVDRTYFLSSSALTLASLHAFIVLLPGMYCDPQQRGSTLSCAAAQPDPGKPQSDGRRPLQHLRAPELGRVTGSKPSAACTPR